MNLNSINANVNRLLTNIWAVILFLKEFAVDGAKDVNIAFVNEDGSESVKIFPNIAKQIASLESWKIDKEIYCSACRTTNAEIFQKDKRYGIIGSFSTNRGFLVGNSESLESGKYIIIPKNGKYRISLTVLSYSSNISHRLYVSSVDKNNENFRPLVFVEPTNGETCNQNANTSVRELKEGDKLFYYQFTDGSSEFYHNGGHTEMSINYLGE